ncbi:MAG: hypothetical protein ACR2MB_09630 [Acidimicrobiales bacterium]
MPQPEDLHEWVSFEDPEEDRTWMFDVTFLMSDWTCIFGRGCKGVLTEDFSGAFQGCCSYGAHFTGPDDIAHTQAMAERLTPDQWQFRDIGRAQGVIATNGDGETTTLLHDDACVFLNRPGFGGDGLGCAFHHAAAAAGERHLDWMPEVCWQLPIRRIDETDDNGHVTSTVREWKRRDWGEGGHDFHWWCTDSPDAFVGRRPVHRELADELRHTVGHTPYQMLVAHLRKRLRSRVAAPKPDVGPSEVYLPHPAVRARKAK